MKSTYRILPILLFFIGCLGFSQTPEQQKMIDKALRMRDSIMECMNLEEMLQQANAKEKNLEQKKNSNINAEPITNATKNEDKYWKNTLASENNRFKNWHNGEADLVYNYRYDSQKDAVEYVKVGVITSDGSILLNPTMKVPVVQPLHNFKNSNNFFDIHDSDVYQYSNGGAGFKLNSYILVYKNEKQIGILTIGNSVKVTRNLLTPGDLYFGDEGYLLSWVYVDEACSIKANENWKGDLSNTGTPLLVETSVSYDLSFKPGWNLVKTEIIGTHEFPNAPEEDRSRYKKHEHTIVDTIPDEAIYFFRSTL
ncbi:hypothetical protein [Maribacter hydrothermalis]|uniref:Uncharacterized protein n=1 Tax=Maribacter hydrothermalis TaxID=1836467 RepID=A0A1B7ZES2_9FLAO|nr:hypothetical protein [Maribacter hydrothermalis]APQ17568.1 hypothetical protein BTR34_09610 [Maribacter hydrothermalis]OBR42043.1 hypothetical protein A9200_01240 [Maribacter hydrothermalis]